MTDPETGEQDGMQADRRCADSACPGARLRFLKMARGLQRQAARKPGKDECGEEQGHDEAVEAGVRQTHRYQGFIQGTTSR